MYKSRWLPILLTTLLLAAAGPLHAAEPVYVDAAWLDKRLGDDSIVVVDMSSDPMQYQRFHLPGAVSLPFGAIVQRGRDGVSRGVDDARLAAVLGSLGITAERHVVVYDDMGGLNAGRLFWELERIGHARVSVLEGGLVDWIRSGRKVEGAPVQPRPAQYVLPSGGRANVIDHRAFRTAAEGGKVTVLDVRSREEYAGDPRQARSGHVPGAAWWPWDESVDFTGTFTRKPVPNLLESLKAAGAGDKTQPVVTYCRSGHRAAQAYLTLRSLGYEDVRLYDGSMLEYERDRTASLKKGMTP